MQDRASISSFFSATLVRRLRRTKQAVAAPSAETHQGAFLFLDMVSFTSLGEQLGTQGIKGAEVLSEVLHAYYRPILATIRDHGGDVVFFAGDAIGAIWLADAENPAKAAARAAQCGLMIQSIVPTITSPWPEPLSFWVSLGVGKVEIYEVGGVADNWMQLVKGEAVDQAYLADEQGIGGQVVLSESSSRHLIPHAADFSPGKPGFLRLNYLRTPLSRAALPVPEIHEDNEEALRARLSVAAHRLLYYPANAVAAEFCRITVVFADISTDDPRLLYAAVQTAQEEVLQLGGEVYQLLEDDKGTKLIVVFGLPGASHADDHQRALMLAQQIHKAHRALELAPRVSIALGTAFCGPLGSADRQQYSIIGSSVNLAARLMSLAAPGQTCCDLQTRKLAAGYFNFQQTVWTTPKGFQDPVPIFSPVARKDRMSSFPATDEIVGRDMELELIAQRVQDAQQTGMSKLVVVRAEVGFGKSAVLEAAQ